MEYQTWDTVQVERDTLVYHHAIVLRIRRPHVFLCSSVDISTNGHLEMEIVYADSKQYHSLC